MRADRLLSMLMLLQARGRLTAKSLAKELEVSERTVYRDLDALSAAGVPVYAERGPGGGCALLNSYRTTLTGLTDDEVRALFMLTVPAALAQLGVGPELKAALLKLSAALPAERRRDETWVRQQIHIDWSGWEQAPGGARGQADEPVPHLRTVQWAVWEDRRLWLAYQRQAGPAIRRFERTADPYGLVAKAGVWHLVCAADGKLRVYRVSRLLEVRLTEERFQRPAGFDLTAFWEKWSARPEVRLPPFLVTLRLAPDLAGALPGAVVTAPADAQGWVTVTAPFEGFESARTRLLGCGRAVEVLEPLSLRHSIADFAAQIVALYSSLTD